MREMADSMAGEERDKERGSETRSSDFLLTIWRHASGLNRNPDIPRRGITIGVWQPVRL